MTNQKLGIKLAREMVRLEKRENEKRGDSKGGIIDLTPAPCDICGSELMPVDDMHAEAGWFCPDCARRLRSKSH